MTFKKIIKTPVIFQMEALECGAAALAIVLAYYKRYVSLEELRVACGISRDGSKAINILRAARQYGLKAEGARAEMDDLAQLTFPFIVFWEFNHFVVVEGIDAKKFYLNDPATGPRTVSYDEFSRGFTGVILLFEPTSAFQSGGQQDTLWQNLKTRYSGGRGALLFITLASLSLVIPGIIIPGFAKIFIDDVLIHQFSGWLLPLIWGMVFIAGMRALLTWLKQIHLARLQIKLVLITSSQFFWHVLRLPISFFSQRFAGDISSRLSSNENIATIISGDFIASLVSLVSLVFFALVMLAYDWVLTSIGILTALANMSILFVILRGIANNSRRLKQEEGKLIGIEVSGIQAIETLKASGGEDDYFQRWAGYHARTLNTKQRIQLYSSVLSILPHLLNGLMYATVLGVGGLRIMHGYLTIGDLIAFQILLVSFNEPLMTLLGFGTKLQEIRGDIMRLDDVLRYPEDTSVVDKTKQQSDELQHIKKLKGNLEVKNVTFGYSLLEPPLLNNIEFTLFSGKSLAVVGRSGSGKSTLAKVICGLYKPWTGEIVLANQKLNQISRSLFSSTLSFVDQDIFLFEGTIRDNLTLWDTTIPLADIEQAIADAELTSLIAERLHGIEDKVIAQGANFSGGQRQQLEIARALVTQPKLLILDEATASLDAKTEEKIIANLKKRGCSLLMIAHRLSTIRSSDEIIVLDQGQIVEHGSHDALLNNKSTYYYLLSELNHAGE
jgi:NHLM bacteriocin system ABC transporter peptidase/ATP-binding protein